MRNRYLDLLRAVAIVRVIVYHHFGWAWLSLAFPAMGVMFALAGSLTAASLSRRPAGQVVTSRLRRLLPPLWALGLLAVPAMIAFGWAAEEDGTHPFTPWKLVFWVLPLGNPPGSEPGIDAWEPLWYIRAYVWFVLLSPLMWFAYRRMGGFGWLLAVAPIAALLFLGRTGLALPETADVVLWDFVTYGACWIVGFTHRDGRLARLGTGAVLGIAAALGTAALYWQSGHQGEQAWDLNDVSESQALWSLAFVLLVLRWQPDMTWLSRSRPLDRFVTLVNNRAVTIYLWHNLAIAALWPVLTFVAFDDLGRLEGPITLAVAFVLTGVAVLLFGWVEDLAAQRRPRFWPASDRPVAAAGTAPDPVAAVGPVPAGWPEMSRDGSVVHPPDPAGPVEPVAVVTEPRTELAGGPSASAHAEPTGVSGPSDLPVAGRPPAPVGYGFHHHVDRLPDEEYDGVPWAGQTRPPEQHRPAGHPDTPAPIRFRGYDDHS